MDPQEGVTGAGRITVLLGPIEEFELCCQVMI